MTLFTRTDEYADNILRDFNNINLENLTAAVTAVRRRGESVNDKRRTNGRLLQEAIYGRPKYSLEGKPYYVNVIENQINNIVGSYIKQNKVPIFLTDELDTTTTDQYNYIYTSLNNKMHYEHVLNKAFEASLAYGECFLNVYLDDTTLNGYPSIRVLTYDRILHDDLWIKDDMSDATWFIISETISKNAARIKFPKFKDQIGYAAREQQSVVGYTSSSTSTQEENSVELVYAWFKTTYMRKYLYNERTGESYYHTFDESLIDEFAKEQGLVIKRKMATKWKVGTLIGDIPVSYVDNPLFDEIPLIPVIHKRRQEIPDDIPKSFGLGHRAYDMIRILNRHIINVHDKLENPTSDYMVIDKTAIVNAEDVKDNSIRHKVFYTDNTDVSGRDAVFRYESPGVPAGTLQMIQQDLDLLKQVTGVSDELLGSAPSQRASAITSMMREESALQSYSYIFQNWDNVLRLFGTKLIKFIQNNWSVIRLKRELGNKDPSEDFYNKTFLEFDVRLSKGERTDSERNRTLQQLTELAPQIQFDEYLYLENMNIEDRESKVEASKLKAQTVQRDDEQARQIAMAKETEQINKLMASAFRDIEAGRERSDRQISNIGLNVERVSEAIKNQAIAMREMADAVRRIKEANISQVEFAKTLKTLEEQVSEKNTDIQYKEDRLLSESEQSQQQDLAAIDRAGDQHEEEATRDANEAAQETTNLLNIQEGGTPPEEV